MKRAGHNLVSGASSPAAALLWEVWQTHRAGFLVLFGAPIAAAIARLLFFYTGPQQAFTNFCVLLLGFSLTGAFTLFKYTESDRRQRFNGFPTRLFTLPVPTFWLVTLPMAGGMAAIFLVYAAWSALVLGPANPGHFALGFPGLYLVTGMLWFQALVWSLAGFPITRLVAIGVWGALLATSWMAFSPLMGGAEFGTALASTLHVSPRTAQSTLLVMLGFAAHGLACWSVARQRRGAGLKIRWPRLRLSWLSAPPAKPFRTPEAAQFWFEWRRNGMVLPGLVGVLLLLVIAAFLLTVPFGGRAQPGTVALTLFWILVLPFALALMIGPGFGKTNFWGQGLSSELGLPLFLAVKPLTAADWLGVKLKTAALSAILTWALLVVLVGVWLLTCCDCSWVAAFQVLPTQVLAGMAVPVVLGLLLATLVTWRLLVVHLYLGVLGSRRLFNAVALFIFALVFGAMFFALWFYNDNGGKKLGWALPWLPWMLGALVVLKLALAIYFLRRALAVKLISGEGALKYFTAWIWGTELLLLVAFVLPVSDAAAQSAGLLAALALPLVRVSLAPLAFVRSRGQ